MSTLARTGALSEQTLARVVKVAAAALVLLLVVFTVFYTLSRRVDSGPTLAERQVDSAEQLVKDAPLNVQARLKLAAVYQQVDRTDEAMAQYDEVLRAVPGNRTALVGAGNLKLKQGDVEGAKALFQQVTKDAKTAEFANVDPQLQAAHYFLGSIAASQNQLDVALTELKAALAIDRADADTLYLLGTVQSRSGDDKAALVSLRRALLFVPTGWCEPYEALQGSYRNLAAADEAEYAGAMVDFCRGDPEAATTRLAAITAGAAAVDALLGLGLIAESTSDRDAAIGWYQKALKASPSNATATTALARLGATPTAPAHPVTTPSTQAKAS